MMKLLHNVKIQSNHWESDNLMFGYLWISGLFLGFLISSSAAFLWYMANRSLKVMSDDWKCCAANQQHQVLFHKQSRQQENMLNWGNVHWASSAAAASSRLWETRGHRSHSTFDVVHNRDYVLSKQLRGAAAELRRLNVLENGPKLWIFLSEQITRQGRAERTEDTMNHN